MLAETSKKIVSNQENKKPELNIILVNGRIKQPNKELNGQGFNSILRNLDLKRNSKI